MAKMFGLVMLMLAVSVRGQRADDLLMDVATDARKTVQHQKPTNIIAVMINELANGIEDLTANPLNENFPCMVCELVVTYVKNMTIDKALLDAILALDERACYFLAPAGFQQYCEDYVKEIPKIIVAFADEYLDPKKDCSMYCGQEAHQQLNVLGNI